MREACLLAARRGAIGYSETLGEPPIKGPQAPFLPLGGHEFRLEGADGPGDVLHWRIHGPVELADIQLALEKIQQIDAHYHHVFLFIRIVGPGGFVPEARRYYFEWRKEYAGDNRWVYIAGASFVARALITLVLRGTALVMGRPPILQLVRDEAEAGHLIAEQRRRHGL